jgi:hypothetical protein
VRRLALALVVLAACKGDHARPAPAPDPHDPHAAIAPADAAGPDANLDTCRAALPQIAQKPASERAQALLDACHPCGDWTPLLTWNTRADDHGPTRAAIDQAMAACRAYCDGNARLRFLGTLDTARGLPTRQPWRLLGEACKDAVSAVPDARYMTAPFFALDRIARALGPTGEQAAIAIALPAVSLTGVAIELPTASVAAAEAAGAVVITVDAVQAQLGTLPTATLTAHGLAVHGDYPGPPVALPALAAALAHAHPSGDAPVIVIAAHALAARRVIDVVRAAGQPVQLAIAAPSPTGWTVAGALPIAMIGKPTAHAETLAIDPTAPVDDLAARLADFAARGTREVAVTARPASQTPSYR